MKPVSVLIITHNRCTILKRCLDSIAAQMGAPPLALMVFDDASTDATPVDIPCYLESLMQKHALVRASFVRSDRNVGVSAARVALSQQLPGDAELVFFIDDDVYLEPHTIRTLADALTADPGVGVIAPRAVLASDPARVLQAALTINRWTGRYSSRDSKHSVVCDAVDPLCIGVRKDALQKSGGFSTQLYRSHEGIDFCLRVKALGYRIVYMPETTVQHDTFPRYPVRERLYYLYRNKIIIAKQHYPFLNRLTMQLFLFLFAFPASILRSLLFHRGPIPQELFIIVQAFFDGFAGRTGPRREESA